MTSSLNALKIAIGMAEKERDTAAGALARAEPEAAQAQAQFDQLVGYARETHARWSPAGRGSATPEVLRHHYLFMERLDQVIALQADVVKRHQRQIEQCRSTLTQVQSRVQALRAVADGLLDRQARATARSEQKQTDEMAARVAANGMLYSQRENDHGH